MGKRCSFDAHGGACWKTAQKEAKGDEMQLKSWLDIIMAILGVGAVSFLVYLVIQVKRGKIK